MDRSWMPTAAGVLNLIAGVLALLGALAVIFLATVATVVPQAIAGPEDDLPLALAAAFFWMLAGLALVCGLVAIIGGVVALRRTGWGWPLAGAIAAFFCAFPVGLLALIFVVACERELRQGVGAPAVAGAAGAG